MPKIVCIPEMTKSDMDFKSRREFEARNRAIIEAQNNKEITGDEAATLQARLAADIEVASNNYKVGGYQGPRLNILRTLSTSTSPTARKFARHLLVGSERPSYLSEAVPAESIGIRLRNDSVVNLAKSYREGFADYMQKKGYAFIDRFSRGALAAAEGVGKFVADATSPITGKQASTQKMETIAREYQREVFQYSHNRKPPDPDSPASQTASFMRQRIGRFNDTARMLGFSEEELYARPPVFLDVSFFRSDSDKLDFVRKVGNGDWLVEVERTTPMGESVIDTVEVTPHIADQMFSVFKKDFADFTYEQELPKQIWVSTSEGGEVLPFPLDFNKTSPLDDFIVQDSQATMQRYFMTMSHRVAMRSKQLVGDDYKIHPRIAARLNADKLAEYRQQFGQEVNEVHGGYEIAGKKVKNRRIDDHYDNLTRQMNGATLAMAGRPPELDTLMNRISNTFPRAIQRLNQFNLVTKLAGIVISASTDLGGLQATLGASGAKFMAKAARKSEQELEDTVHFMGAAQEAASGWVTARQAGYSTNTSVRSSPIDAALNSLVQFFGTATGINRWNDFVQRGAIFGVQDGFVREIIEGGASTRFTGLMERYGIKAKMREDIKEQILKHGVYMQDTNSLGIQRWTQNVNDLDELKNVRKLQEKVAAAFNTMAVDHTLMPFSGTLPLWAQNPASKLVLQFRSIVFSSWMRLAQAPIERGKFSRDDMVALTTNVGMGYLVYEAKRNLYGRPEADSEADLAFRIAGEMSHTALPMMGLYGANLFGAEIPGMHKPSVWSAAMFMGGPAVDNVKQATQITKHWMGLTEWDNPMTKRAYTSFIPYRSHPAIVPAIREITDSD